MRKFYINLGTLSLFVIAGVIIEEFTWKRIALIGKITNVEFGNWFGKYVLDMKLVKSEEWY